MCNNIGGQEHTETQKYPFPDLPVIFYHSVIIHDIKILKQTPTRWNTFQGMIGVVPLKKVFLRGVWGNIPGGVGRVGVNLKYLEAESKGFFIKIINI